VVEDSVEARGELIDGIGREHVGFGHRHVAPMIGDVLCAGKRTWLGEAWGPAGHEGIRLVVAESGEYGVFAGKVVIQTHVKLSLIEFSRRDVGEVETA